MSALRLDRITGRGIPLRGHDIDTDRVLPARFLVAVSFEGSEAHLFEDPNAPMFIRAEQTKAANLQVLLVLYGYYAFTFARVPHARKVSGTGLVTPTF